MGGKVCPFDSVKNYFSERSYCMNWNIFIDVSKDIVRFFDRVMGWAAFVCGAADDPYSYHKFYDAIWGGEHLPGQND